MAFKFPSQIERILATTAAYCGQTNQTKLQRIIVNARAEIDEGVEHDNWDGGIDGHRVRLKVPAELYYEMLNESDAVEEELKTAMSRFTRIDGEYICSVVVEAIDATIPNDWRVKSGLIVSTSVALTRASDNDVERLWDKGFYRLFLSHKTEFKVQAGELKKALANFGVSVFVAHEDIEPTREWQGEIERALFSMELLVAFLTPGFGDSKWTDQEIGIALGRGTPVVPLRVGLDPYGFIGKYQGLQAKGKSAYGVAVMLFDLLWTKPEIQPRLVEAIVSRIESSTSFEMTNRLIAYLCNLEKIPAVLMDRLENAVTSNSNVRGSFSLIREIDNLRRKSA